MHSTKFMFEGLVTLNIFLEMAYFIMKQIIKNYFGKGHYRHQEIDFFINKFIYDIFLTCQYPSNLDPVRSTSQQS